VLRAVRSLPVAGALALALVLALVLVVVASASAAWGGKDPAHNTPIRRVPTACFTAPAGQQCINAAVSYLDKARSHVHLPPYALPANFPSLPPTRELFILVNLDRIAYGLPPIPGMTAALDHDALVSGVWVADDPHPSHTTNLVTWWPGWAGAFYNAPMAYEAWVWDDGLGSNNPRCTPTDHSRCWGHRHSVLWKFPAGSVRAVGLAAGTDSSHHRGYAYLFVGGNAGYRPKYTYTWKQAIKAGAGTYAYDPRAQNGMCNVPVAVGSILDDATAAIEKAHCSVGDVVQANTDEAAGVVVEQHPAPGKWRAHGAGVRLTVSLGPPTETTPSP
jgi:hypothetical protein